MALNPETIVWARIGVSDMLTACMGGALLSFFLGYAHVKTSGTSALVSCFYVPNCPVLTKGSGDCLASADYWFVSALPW